MQGLAFFPTLPLHDRRFARTREPVAAARLYLDRLVGRNARAGKKAVKRHHWGVPGLSWDPATEPDPFA